MSQHPEIKILNSIRKITFDDLEIGDLFIFYPENKNPSIYKKINNDTYVSVVGKFKEYRSTIIDKIVSKIIINYMQITINVN